MTLEEQLKKFGREFASYPVKDLKYNELMEIHEGEVLHGDINHPTGKVIAFEFYDVLDKNVAIAYKPVRGYGNK